MPASTDAVPLRFQESLFRHQPSASELDAVNAAPAGDGHRFDAAPPCAHARPLYHSAGCVGNSLVPGHHPPYEDIRIKNTGEVADRAAMEKKRRRQPEWTPTVLVGSFAHHRIVSEGNRSVSFPSTCSLYPSAFS